MDVWTQVTVMMTDSVSEYCKYVMNLKRALKIQSHIKNMHVATLNLFNNSGGRLSRTL